ncbi:hypothetical protein SAY87_004361 [Trapa incisa]|uniref:RING-type domain-containing protein n=1 Tax=Trapa incisa TaxID=236973 RepID=A0AAN7JNS4_9MYRT|nr:hypothetical protein SAY87_004361 [Trapa incisa]
MSTQTTRSRPIRLCCQRRRGLDLDLNSAPPSEIPEAEDITSQNTSLQRPDHHGQTQGLALIDVDAIDDDVVISSPRAFAEARNKAQRNRLRSGFVDIDSEGRVTRSGNNHNRRRRVTPNQSAVNTDLCINLETSNDAKSSAPNGPSFSCPICLGLLVNGTTTKCGHIFCKTCIKAAISAQGKCPTCRTPVVMKDLIRVFLPSARVNVLLAGHRLS